MRMRRDICEDLKRAKEREKFFNHAVKNKISKTNKLILFRQYINL